MFDIKTEKQIKLNELIRSARLAHNISQAELAKGICSRETITKIEDGTIEFPSLRLLLRICEKLNIPHQEVFAYQYDLMDIDLPREQIEILLFREDRDALKQVLHNVSSTNNFEARYLMILGQAFDYFKTNQPDKLHTVIDDYFREHKTPLSIDDIRLRSNQLRILSYKNRKELKVMQQEVSELVGALIRKPLGISCENWLVTAINLADVARMCLLPFISIELLNVCTKIIDDKELWRYKPEVLLTEAGVACSLYEFKVAQSKVAEAERIYKLFPNKEKEILTSFLRQTIEIVEKHAENCGRSNKKFSEEINALLQKYNKIV